MGIHSQSVYQIGWQSGVNGQTVHLHPAAHRGERSMSVFTLYEQRGHGPVIRLLSEDQWRDPLLSKQIAVAVHPV